MESAGKKPSIVPCGATTMNRYGDSRCRDARTANDILLVVSWSVRRCKRCAPHKGTTSTATDA